MQFLNFGKDKAGDKAPARRAFFVGAVLLAAGATVAIGATSAQAWHNGYPHDGGGPSYGYGGGGGGGHNKWKSQEYSGHNKWKSEEHYDSHSYKKSQYQKKKYYHQKYGSWQGHPQCLHLGPFGVCEY